MKKILLDTAVILLVIGALIGVGLIIKSCQPGSASKILRIIR